MCFKFLRFLEGTTLGVFNITVFFSFLNESHSRNNNYTCILQQHATLFKTSNKWIKDIDI